MNSEQQQQRIMSYFIEEAQEHLQTIEQGVLDLQGVLADVERINELFRAAHSIKGGAAMLDLGSIQHISHRFEDYFKILKDNPGVEVDEKLKSLFLAGCDRLHELLDYLQENYTISKELADAKVAEVEPVFSDLESHLNNLVAVLAPAEDTFLREQRAERHAYEDLMAAFQAGVADELRNMLQLFKQEDTQTTRQQLQDVCDRLFLLGENLGLSGWQELISTSKSAISDLTNPYLTLAQVIIRDIRQAQDLVLAQRSQEISISDQLLAI
jgi:chemotaxis protein histidine kinase CheA